MRDGIRRGAVEEGVRSRLGRGGDGGPRARGARAGTRCRLHPGHRRAGYQVRVAARRRSGRHRVERGLLKWMRRAAERHGVVHERALRPFPRSGGACATPRRPGHALYRVHDVAGAPRPEGGGRAGRHRRRVGVLGRAQRRVQGDQGARRHLARPACGRAGRHVHERRRAAGVREPVRRRGGKAGPGRSYGSVRCGAHRARPGCGGRTFRPAIAREGGAPGEWQAHRGVRPVRQRLSPDGDDVRRWRCGAHVHGGEPL